MDYILRILNESISGLIYFAAFFIFFILLFDKEKKSIKFIIEHSDIMLYLGIVVILASITINSIAKTFIQSIIPIFEPHSTFNGKNTIKMLSLPPNIIEENRSLYMGLTFYRHLLISTTLLGISLLIWFKREKKIFWNIFYILVVFILVILINYFITRNGLISFLNAINIK